MSRFLLPVVAWLCCTLLASAAPQPAPQDGAAASAADSAVSLQRVSTAVPWPRGIVWHEGKLLVLARGVHRSAGGPNPEIADQGGTIFELDPTVFEPVVAGQAPGEAVRANGRVLVRPSEPPFKLWDRIAPAIRDTLTDRPYAGLVKDPVSRSLFVLAFSGIDTAETPYMRKNATDAVHRYDMRSGLWHVVENHDQTAVPAEKLGQWIGNETYPHHDPGANPPPHGLANGPCGGWVVGRYLYVTAKDNSALIQYDLAELQRSGATGPPPARFIFNRSGPHDDPFLQTRDHGNMYVEGACAVTAHEGMLYVAFRTTSQVVRFPIDSDGDVVQPIVAEYLAQFDPYEKQGEGYSRSADIFDMRTDSRGNLYVSCNGQGTIGRRDADAVGVLNARKGTT